MGDREGNSKVSTNPKWGCLMVIQVFPSHRHHESCYLKCPESNWLSPSLVLHRLGGRSPEI